MSISYTGKLQVCKILPVCFIIFPNIHLVFYVVIISQIDTKVNQFIPLPYFLMTYALAYEADRRFKSEAHGGYLLSSQRMSLILRPKGTYDDA